MKHNQHEKHQGNGREHSEEHNRERSKEHSFDSYCKRILKNESRDYHRHLKYRREHEVSLSELPEESLAQLSTWDKYFEEERRFGVMGMEISVNDGLLAEALKSLPANRLEIILLSYFLGMSDPEIAEHLNLVRRTVAHRRANALRTLKKAMEEE